MVVKPFPWRLQNLWQMREDARKGVYVEGLTEVEVHSVQDVIQLLLQVCLCILFLRIRSILVAKWFDKSEFLIIVYVLL